MSNKAIKSGPSKDDLFPPEQIHIAVDTHVSNTFHVHFDEDIGEPSYYRNLQSVLRNAGPDDTIVFHMNTEGGQVNSMLPLVAYIKDCEAHTVAVLEGFVASAGTFIITATDAVVALPHAQALIHAASYGVGGKSNTIKEYVDFQDKWIKTFMEDVYEGFLSEKEMADVIDNSKDLIFTADEVIERLVARSELLGADRTAILAEDHEEVEEIISVPKKRNPRKKIEKTEEKV